MDKRPNRGLANISGFNQMIQNLTIVIAFCAVFGTLESVCGQGTGGTGTTGSGTTNTGTTGTTTGTGQGGNVSLPTAPLDLSDQLTSGPGFTRATMFETVRVQPFVGPSTANIIHPRSQIDPAGSTLGSSGGSGGSGFTFSTGGQNRAQQGSGNTGFGGIGSSTQGFSVSRRGVRSAVRYTPIALPAGNLVSTNFTRRLNRLPAFQNVGAIEMKVDNRVATLSGVVADAEQKSLIAGQAELEPGVSRVVNNLEIAK